MKKILIIVFAALMLIPAAGAQEPVQKINKKNLVIKEWNTDPKGGNRTLDHMTTYNAEGKKIEEVEYGTSGQKWRKRYEYGPDNRVSRELVYDEFNRLQTIKKIEYNEFGRKKIQYTYNAKGKLLTVKNFEYLAQDAD
ncbi:MAG: hypothetical protein IJ627_00530 [Bacteroidales bacterium]|nr:hypothetical protein [Bacteroidales bacterium]